MSIFHNRKRSRNHNEPPDEPLLKEPGEAPDEAELDEEEPETRNEEGTKEEPNQNAKEKDDEQLELEKGDFTAMILAAIITFGPFILAVIVAFVFVAWFFVWRH